MSKARTEEAGPATPSLVEVNEAASVVVVVEVEGGLVQRVFANGPLVAVHVLDRDNQKDGDCSEDELEHYGNIESLLADPMMRNIL